MRNSRNKYKRLHLEIAKDICNQNCIYCYYPYYKERIGSYDYSKLPVILEFCRDNYVEEVFLQGGEATINDNIYNFCLDLVKKTSSKISLVTNGQEFNQRWIKLFAEHGLEVNFSLNTISPQKYKEISGGGELMKSIENVIRFYKYKEKVSSKCITTVSIVLCTLTIDEIIDFYLLAKEIKADRVRYFFDLTSSWRLNFNDINIKEELKNSFDCLLNTGKNKPEIQLSDLNVLKNLMSYNNNLFNNLSAKCTSPWDSFFIDHDLNVSACCHSNFFWGNLKESSLTAIISGEKRETQQNYFLNNNFMGCSFVCPNFPKKVFINDK